MSGPAGLDTSDGLIRHSQTGLVERASTPRPQSDRPANILIQPGQTGILLDPHGWMHLVQDGREIDCWQGDFRRITTPPLPMLPDISKLDDAVTMYEEQAEEWKSSSSFERDILTTFLKREILGHGHPSGLRLEVDTCVGIGLGTFTAKRDGRRDGPVEQLIAFKTMVEVLRQDYNVTRVFIQDPDMNSIDIALLDRLGIKTLEEPEAQNSVTSSTLIYAPSCKNSPAQDMFRSGNAPAVFIGEDIQTWLYTSRILRDKHESEVMEWFHRMIHCNNNEVVIRDVLFRRFLEACETTVLYTGTRWTRHAYWQRRPGAENDGPTLW